MMSVTDLTTGFSNVCDLIVMFTITIEKND